MRVETLNGIGLRSAQPTPPAEAIGQLYIVTDEDVVERWSGTAWVQVATNGGTGGSVTLAQLAALGLSGTIVMSEGITDPPEPVWNEAGTDYIYAEVGQ